MTIKKAKTFTVIYRTGGTENFKWHKVLTLHRTKETAMADVKRIEKQGYKALMFDTDKLNAIGMPDNAKRK